ncbi:glycosyltransferase [Pseudanabaena sp. FACHB-2040]|uniref:glycosyltransferase n=1 Tax=Pseudanabaena sp. FACHB-2040 TaxID=2692859 RepID=UPI001684041D|nr:glycosyltransferase [Pseudanabaena sp. FACHB-2040]
MKKISIVTPCFNAQSYIEETIESVINQKAILQARCELEYIIVDGGSTDETILKSQSFREHSQASKIKLISEPDRGMYDALAKGLKQCSGDIVAYINAGDYYHSSAFDIVLDIFASKKVNWLTGYNTVYNENSSIVSVELPYRYRRELITCGFYGRTLPPLQQESTFWASSLLNLIDYDFLASLKYAGDYYLWLQFAKEYQLSIVQSYIGGFRVHKGQISGDKSAYYHEVDQLITAKPSMRNYIQAKIDSLLWYMPGRLKKKFNQEHLFRFNHELQSWI